MNRFHTTTLILMLVIVFVLPSSVFAAEEPGIKPGNFFYGFKTAFEKVDLFFTFNPEKKVGKALAYADERLAEIEYLAESENNDRLIQKVVNNYSDKVSLATEKSKSIKNEMESEKLLNTILEQTSKHQEFLAELSNKAMGANQEALKTAVEASRKEYEKVSQEVTSLNKKVAILKEEIQRLHDTIQQTQGQQVQQTPANNTATPRTPAPTPTPNDPCEKLTQGEKLDCQIGEYNKAIGRNNSTPAPTPVLITTPIPTPNIPGVPLDATDKYSPSLVSVTLENSTAPAGSTLGVSMVIRDDKNETQGLGVIEFKAPDGAGTLQQNEGYNQWNSGPILISRVIGNGYVEDTWHGTIKVPSLPGLWKGYRVDFADKGGNRVQFFSTAGTCTNTGQYMYPNQDRGAFDNLPCIYNLDLLVTTP